MYSPNGTKVYDARGEKFESNDDDDGDDDERSREGVGVESCKIVFLWTLPIHIHLFRKFCCIGCIV